MGGEQSALHGAGEGMSAGATAALRLVFASALAGGLVGLVDVMAALAGGLDALSAAGFFILVTFAALAVGWLFSAVGALVARLVARFPRLAPALVPALLVLLAATPLGRALFSGAGVSRTTLGRIGPYAFPAAAGLLTFVGYAWFTAAGRQLARGRLWRALLASAAAVLALLFDRTVLVGLYTYVHALAVLSALGSLTLALELVLPRRRWHAEAAAVVSCVVVLGFLVLSRVFPQHNVARAFLVERHPFAERIMAGLSGLADFDGDGGSMLFAGGDCDDFDPDVGRHALDIPVNNIDEDCDGRDAAPVPARRSYGGDLTAAHALSSLTRVRPTVVIVIDALRADRVGRPEFPHLAQFAANSVQFVNAYASASSTARSVPGMVTGLALPTPADVSALEVMRSRGVDTALVTVDIVADTVTGKVKTPGTLRYPFLRGFSRVELVHSGHDAEKSWGGGITASTDARVTERAFAVLDGKDAPPFLWVHYFDLHQWMMLDEIRERGFARYDATLRRVDEQIGRWLARKDALNLVLVSDHGEALGQHGTPAHTQYLWSSLVRVPVLLSLPGVAPERLTTPVTLVDLAPTVLSLVGLSPAPYADYDLLTLIGSGPHDSSEFGAYETRQVSLLDGHYRVIFDVKTRAAWLYDLEHDPEEQHSLTDQEPARAQRMIERAMALRVVR